MRAWQRSLKDAEAAELIVLGLRYHYRICNIAKLWIISETVEKGPAFEQFLP